MQGTDLLWDSPAPLNYKCKDSQLSVTEARQDYDYEDKFISFSTEIEERVFELCRLGNDNSPQVFMTAVARFKQEFRT